MKPDLLTTIIGTAPTFFGVLFVVWQIGRVQDQLNKRIDDLQRELNKRIDDVQSQLNKRIDDMRDTLRTEIRASIAEVRFK